MNTELTIELSCGRCNFTKIITIGLDEDGVYTIPNKFCPNDLNGLGRIILETKPVSVPKSDGPKKLDGPTKNTTRTSNTLSKPARTLERPQNGDSDSKKS